MAGDWNDRTPDGKPTEWGDRISDELNVDKYRKRLRPQILSLWGVHFVMAFGYIVLINLISTVWEGHTGEWIVSAFCICVFIILYFSQGSNYGSREHNMMNYGHLSEDIYRGLKASLFAAIPGFLCACVAVVYIFITDDNTGTPVLFYRFVYAPFVKVQQIIEEVTPLLCFFPVILMPSIYHLGYMLGYKNIVVLDRMMYTRKKTDEPREPKLK